MIVESIRLRNIKSFREGADGNGILVRFAKGVNRVAGRNGHGKTTIIESLGYALFLTNPQFEENFQLEIYFLSHGAKEGSIEVTFHCDGEAYRVERPVGRNAKRRHKIIQLSDNSICAEDKEVPGFICRLLKVTDCDRLAEIFCKLIGIKQGRLAWPFDSKAADAKKHFEPLFDVQVFRDCFDHLKGAVEVFYNERNELHQKRAGLQVSVQERADAPQKLQLAREAVLTAEEKLLTAQAALQSAEEAKNSMEKAEETFRTTQTSFQAAEKDLDHATQRRDSAQNDVTLAKAAVERMELSKVAHDAYVSAEQALRELEARRLERDKLRDQHQKVGNSVIAEKHNADAERGKAKIFQEDYLRNSTELDETNGKLTKLRTALEESAPSFKQSAEEAALAANNSETTARWVSGLDSWKNRQQETAAKIKTLSGTIAAWDENKFISAQQMEETARKHLGTIENHIAVAKQQRDSLQTQLAQIQGGVCPFLKDNCRQFDPAKVQGDVLESSKSVTILEAELPAARTALTQATSRVRELREAANTFAADQRHLLDCLNAYRTELSSLTSEEAARAISWLVKWKSAFPPFPSAPSQQNSIHALTVPAIHADAGQFIAGAQNWWRESHARLKDFQKEHSELEKNRQKDELNLGELSERLKRLNTDADTLISRAEEAKKKADQNEAAAQELLRQSAQFEARLKLFASLDDELKREQQKRDTHRDGYQAYLQAKGIADDLPTRIERFQAAHKLVQAAQHALALKQSAFESAKQTFDPAKLAESRKSYEEKRDLATAQRVVLTTLQGDARREETRLTELQAAQEKLQDIIGQIGRCDASITLTEFGRRTLRDCAPAVAQHLCDRIARHAQQVFNQINPEPIELSWDAERYSLRVAPGDRRFAMLSGGEQTKLALATTLAMIQEFSGLRFCVFDEPTYGVDLDSRHKLADAILLAQEAAGLDQLFLVSHDDAFEDKIEHAILLEKSASGSRVAE